MVCGTIKLALTAVLLAGQQLKVEAKRAIQADCSAQAFSLVQVENPNAVIVLRDAKGRSLFEEKIRVGRFDYYHNGVQRGAVPAKRASFFYSYPANAKTLRAETVELRLLNQSYLQAASLNKTSIKGLL